MACWNFFWCLITKSNDNMIGTKCEVGFTSIFKLKHLIKGIYCTFYGERKFSSHVPTRNDLINLFWSEGFILQEEKVMDGMQKHHLFVDEEMVEAIMDLSRTKGALRRSLQTKETKSRNDVSYAPSQRILLRSHRGAIIVTEVFFGIPRLNMILDLMQLVHGAIQCFA